MRLSKRILPAILLLIVSASAMADELPSLRRLAEPAGPRIGAAVSVSILEKDSAYRSLLATQFDLATPENAMKFSVIHPERGRYDFSHADALVAFAERHGMAVNGHVLVWDQQLPDWLIQGRFSRDELKAILRDHIETLVSRYKGRVVSWDVAAEAVGEDGRQRETFWSRGIGPDYLELAFRWAHAADPKAILRYNDYGGEDMGAKSQGIYHLMDTLLGRGVPVGAVGLQMHVSPDDAPGALEVRMNMNRLAALGLETDITEMDVALREPATSAALADQAAIYGSMFRVCLNAPSCRSFSTWGVTDRYSWIPEFFPGQGSALLFDTGYAPKPAFRQLAEQLRSRR